MCILLGPRTQKEPGHYDLYFLTDGYFFSLSHVGLLIHTNLSIWTWFCLLWDLYGILTLRYLVAKMPNKLKSTWTYVLSHIADSDGRKCMKCSSFCQSCTSELTCQICKDGYKNVKDACRPRCELGHFIKEDGR